MRSSLTRCSLTRPITTALICVFLAACGGGGGGENSAPVATNNSPDTAGANQPSSGDSSSTPGSGTPVSNEPTGGSPASPATPSAPATPTSPIAPTFVHDETARFNGPASVTADAAGNLYVLDTGNKSIRRISASGEVSTLPATLAMPIGLERDITGNLYTNDAGTIRKIAPDGNATTALATGLRGALWMTIDPESNLYVLDVDYDTGTGAIRRISQDGNVTTLFSGSPLNDQNRGIARDAAGNLYVGTNTGAILKFPVSGEPTIFARGIDLVADMAFDSAGNLYVSDFMMASCVGSTCSSQGLPSPFIDYSGIRRITPNGVVTTVLAAPPGASGTGAAERFGSAGIMVGVDGNLYATYSRNHTVHKITPTGDATTIAGKAGESGSSD